MSLAPPPPTLPPPPFHTMPSPSTPSSDSESSVYSSPPSLPTPRNAALNPTNLSKSDSEILDAFLDEEEENYCPSDASTTPSSDSQVGAVQVLDDDDDEDQLSVEIIKDDDLWSNDVSSDDSPPPPINREPHIVEATAVLEDDDEWFDSDENRVSVSSSSSSSTTPSPPAVPTSSGEKDGGTKGKGLLARASQTFYKAWKGRGKKSDTIKKVETVHEREDEKEDAIERRYAALETALEAQIRTLNAARGGFVELRVVKGMTAKTVALIEKDGRVLLKNFGRMEKKAREVENGASTGAGVVGELEMKERLLIEAKVKLAEAAAEVEQLRHELSVLKRSSGDRDGEVRKWEEGRRRREKVVEQVGQVKSEREGVERRLGEQRRKLNKENTRKSRVEDEFRDLQGDWA